MASNHLRMLVLATALATGVASVAPIQQAQATTLAPLSVEQLTDASYYVVRGEITETWTEVDDHGDIWTRARMKVTHTFKGPDTPSELILDSLGGEYAGEVLHIPAQAVFSEHEEAIAFLEKRENDDRLVPVAKFLGKYTIRRAPDDGRYYARTWHPQAGLKFDARFLPHPAPERRVYLDGLLDRIETRVENGWDGQPIPGVSAKTLAVINAPDRRFR